MSQTSLRRFFYHHPDFLTPLYNLDIGSELPLSDAVFHHWCRVLRASCQEQGILFDGYGTETRVQLSNIHKKNASVTLLAHHHITRQADINTTIAMVMSRGDRTDYAIQKATELGATHIQLLSSHHGEVRLKTAQVDKKLAHWQQVALSACEQCGLNYPPLVHAPLPMTAWLSDRLSTNLKADTDRSHTRIEGYVTQDMTTIAKQAYYQYPSQLLDADAASPLKLILTVPHHDVHKKLDVYQHIIAQIRHFNDLATPPERLAVEILVGPEGGFSEDERDSAHAAGFMAWQLGDRVLRAETAPVVALSTLYTLTKIARA